MFEETGNDAIVDEFTYGQYQDRVVAQTKLRNHWSTFYSEDDFRLMHEYGLNHARYASPIYSTVLEPTLCRIPISWWSVPMEQDTGPYITGAWPYVLKALDWAAAHNIYVILDLHGAPASQNGFDNSGLRTGDPQWGLQQSNINATVNIISYIAKEVGKKVSVIELLNEIAGFRQSFGDAARQYWSSGYKAVRAAVGMEPKVMIGDAFLGVGSWNGYMNEPEASGVIMDLVGCSDMVLVDDLTLLSTACVSGL
jgi:glucan 1,3-beta-glucosidase